MTPSNAIFRTLYGLAMAHGDTYDYVPDASTKYQFIYVGEAFNADTSNIELIGTVRQTIHLYGTRTQRNALDTMAMRIHDDAVKVRQAFNYKARMTAYNDRVVNDNSTATPLLHYILELEFQYTKRG